jgi:hypothetical protein
VLELGGVTDIDNEDESGIVVFPNPASDFLTIRGLGDNAQGNYTLYDLSGRAVQSGVYLGDSFSVPIDSLQDGRYILRINIKTQTLVYIISKLNQIR